jgi:hypothetical protein
MPAVPMHRVSLRVTAADGAAADPAVIEQFALDLRAELSDGDIARIDQIVAGPAPEGARALEILAAFEFIITMVEAGEAVGKILAAIRRVAGRYAERRQRLKVTVADVEIDLATATDEQRRMVIDAIAAQVAPPAAGVRRALIIANKEFDDPALTQLRAPGHDADALARVLGNITIGGFEVDLLVDADERTVRHRIAEFFANRAHDDVLLLHFSGHGVKDARGRLFLTARDTKLALLGATGIAASFINDQLDETQSKRVVLILDCCYSGAFARGAGVRADDSVHVDDAFGAGNGRIVLTASSATEYAFEGTDLTRSEGTPSAFTSALVQGLQSGEADLDADGEITIDELYEYTYRQVRASTPGQAPMKWSFGVEGSLVIARSTRPAVLPQIILDDLQSDRGVLREEAVKALARLIETGKRGHQIAAAAALVELRDHDDSARVRAAASAALGDRTALSTPAKPAPGASTPAVAASAVPATPVPAQRADPAPATGIGRATVPASGPSPASGNPTVSRPARTPATGPAPEHLAKPDPAAVDPWSARRSAPLMLGAILTIISASFDVIGRAVNDQWTLTPILFDIASIIAGIALLATGASMLAGLAAGLLAWNWTLVGVYSDNGAYGGLGRGGVPIVVGNYIGIVALILLVLGLLLLHSDETRPLWGRIVGAVVLLPGAVLMGIDVAYILAKLIGASLSTGNGWVYKVGFLAGLVLPLFAGLRPQWRTSAILAIGWFAGGFAIVRAGQAAHLEILSEDIGPAYWSLLILAVVTIFVLWPWGRRRPAPTR